jgi:hypothetical protein
MSKPNYQKLYRGLDESGFFTDRKSEGVVNGFRVSYTLTFTMKPNGVNVTCAIPGYSRSKGKISSPKVRVVEFFNDGSAWVAQPGKLSDAMKAVETLIEQRKASEQHP